jgi:hypothetical protein
MFVMEHFQEGAQATNSSLRTTLLSLPYVLQFVPICAVKQVNEEGKTKQSYKFL